MIISNLPINDDAAKIHINNKNNPHNVTAEQIGAVAADIPMSLSVTTDGILRVTYDDGN